MKKTFLFISAIIFFGIAVVLLASSVRGTRRYDNSGKPKVAASIFPIADIAKNVAGADFDIVTILPPGASPHTFEPRPEDVLALSSVKLVFTVGHNLDGWAAKIADSGKAQVVVVDRGIPLIADEEEGGVNPHYWLSITNAKRMSETIADKLEEQYPEYTAKIETNLATYLGKLDEAQQVIETKLANAKTHTIATFHDAWGYYAQDYGLDVVATFEEFPGKEPTPTYLNNFIKIIKANSIKVIFAEPQFSSESIKAVASDMNATIDIIDPEGGSGAASYIDLMISNTTVIAQALNK